MTRFIISLALFIGLILPSSAAIVPKVIKTPGGLTAWYVYDEKTPVIALNFLFRGGASLDPAGKSGVAVFAAHLMGSGTMDKDPGQFDAYQQDYAIQMNFSANVDALQGSLTTLVQNKDKAFDLLKEALTKPRLKADIFDNIMNMSRTSLANATNDPSYLARRRLDTMLFKGHPYELPAEGLPQTIEKITIADVGTYIKSNLTHDRLVIAVTGNIKEEDAIAMLDKAFGSLPQKSTAPPVNKIIPAIQGQSEIIDLKIPQSLIFFVLPGVNYDNPDFIKAAIMMHVMGQDLSGRLFKEIREKRGLAYVASAGSAWRQQAGYVAGMVGSPKAKAAQSIGILKQEWTILKKDGITAEELENAKDYMLNSYPLKFKNSSAIAEILIGYQFVNRPIDYFQKRESLVASITLKEMNDFITRVVEPEKLTFVIVGRPDEAPVVKDLEKAVGAPKG